MKLRPHQDIERRVDCSQMRTPLMMDGRDARANPPPSIFRSTAKRLRGPATKLTSTHHLKTSSPSNSKVSNGSVPLILISAHVPSTRASLFDIATARLIVICTR